MLSFGTRQECSLSPLIFALVIDSLESNIWDGPLTIGPRVNSTAHSINLFADDILLLLTSLKDVIPALQIQLERSGEVVDINEKLELMCIILLDTQK